MNETFVGEDVIRRLIKFDGWCCGSCHDDADEGYSSMIFIELGKNRFAEVCCSVHTAYEDWLKRKNEMEGK